MWTFLKNKSRVIKTLKLPGAVAHGFNFSSQKAGAGWSLWFWGQQALHGEFQSELYDENLSHRKTWVLYFWHDRIDIVIAAVNVCKRKPANLSEWRGKGSGPTSPEAPPQRRSYWQSRASGETEFLHPWGIYSYIYKAAQLDPEGEEWLEIEGVWGSGVRET